MSKLDPFLDLQASRPIVEGRFIKEKLAKLRANGQLSWLVSTPAARSTGRFPKTAMERVSIKTCYWWLRARCPEDWSDQMLSRELKDPTDEARSFERMRRSGVAPEGIWKLLVPRIDNVGVESEAQEPTDEFLLRILLRPEFSGFKETFRSNFWTVLNKSSSTLLAVRSKLNEWMANNGFVRLEAGLNCVVDDLAAEFEKGPDASGMLASPRHSYSQWLFFALEQLEQPFERLVFLGLLQREAMLLGYVERAYTIAQIIPVWIKRACPVCRFSNPIRQRQYEDYCREFEQVIYTYMLRGHIESSLENDLYPQGSEAAVQGYILDKQSGFVTEDREEALADWRRVQNWNIHEVNAAISLGGLPLPDLVDDAYLEAVLKELGDEGI